MRRIVVTPRENWQQIVAAQGFHFHSTDEQPYWNESACYAFRTDEIDLLERATYALNDMCLKAVEHILEENRLGEFGIPPLYHDWLRKSWETDEHTIYGRFDLAYRDGQTPRLLEFNADTPTSLLEAAVVQWHWLQATHFGQDQFNSLHERLIDAWRTCGVQSGPIHFAAQDDSLEDFMTANYLRDTAMQAGLATEYLAVQSLGWDAARRCFVDLNDQPIGTIFKLYPWEWLLAEEFAPHLLTSPTRWLEPPWKMLLSNKLILALLWELFPENPYLLAADTKPLSDRYVRKPRLGREGANVAIMKGDEILYETAGDYDGAMIYQQYTPLAEFDERYAVLGSWLVNGYACGLGIREDVEPVTRNTSQFVPHYIE